MRELGMGWEIELCLTVLPMCLLSIISHDTFWHFSLDGLCLSVDEVVLFLDGNDGIAVIAVFQTHYTIMS